MMCLEQLASKPVVHSRVRPMLRCRAGKPQPPQCRTGKPRAKARAAAVALAFLLAFPAPLRLVCRAGRRSNWERFAEACGADVLRGADGDWSLAVFGDDSCAVRDGADVRVYRRAAILERDAGGRVTACAAE